MSDDFRRWRNPHYLGKHIWYYEGTDKITFCLDVDRLTRIGGGIQFDLPWKNVRFALRRYDAQKKRLGS